MISDLVVEEATRSDSTPDQTCVEMCPGERTAESVHCVGCADAFDVAQAPVKDAYAA